MALSVPASLISLNAGPQSRNKLSNKVHFMMIKRQETSYKNMKHGRQFLCSVMVFRAINSRHVMFGLIDALLTLYVRHLLKSLTSDRNSFLSTHGVVCLKDSKKKRAQVPPADETT